MKNIKKVIFQKIQNNHNALRDDEIHGETFCLPVVGKPFYMTAPPRDIKVGYRQVNTSPVIEIISSPDDSWDNREHDALVDGGATFESGKPLLPRKKITIFKTESGSIYSVEEKK